MLNYYLNHKFKVFNKVVAVSAIIKLITQFVIIKIKWVVIEF